MTIIQKLAFRIETKTPLDPKEIEKINTQVATLNVRYPGKVALIKVHANDTCGFVMEFEITSHEEDSTVTVS